MKILVTGGAGFIGSWVSEVYVSNGHEVLVIDNLSTGRKENIPSGVEFENCDILDNERIFAVFDKFRPEIVNHHAAQINVRNSISNPVFDASTNIVGSVNLMDMCQKFNVRKIIFASTGGAIYGEPDRIPTDENTKPMPLSPYGVSKMCVEKYLELYNRNYGIDYVSLRYSNVYGKRQNPDGEAGVISIFCKNIITGKSCDVYGDGKQTRDYIYCEDVALANLKSLTAESGIYNISRAEQTSLLELIEKLKVISNRDFNVNFEEPRQGEVRYISLDNTLAGEKLMWAPVTTLDNGLKYTWQWFLKEIQDSVD